MTSFVNVDVLHMADILTTSPAKSFNGYADVIAGSVILKPNGRHYTEVKSLFAHRYTPELHVADVRTILQNNTDYLDRTITLNANAASIVSYLKGCAKDPDSAIKAFHYPTTLPSCKNYASFLRRPTPEFPTPGYGCLFSVELRDLPSTVTFYDNLNVHKSVHLACTVHVIICVYDVQLWSESGVGRAVWADSEANQDYGWAGGHGCAVRDPRPYWSLSAKVKSIPRSYVTFKLPAATKDIQKRSLSARTPVTNGPILVLHVLTTLTTPIRAVR